MQSGDRLYESGKTCNSAIISDVARETCAISRHPRRRFGAESDTTPANDGKTARRCGGGCFLRPHSGRFEMPLNSISRFVHGEPPNDCDRVKYPTAGWDEIRKVQSWQTVKEEQRGRREIGSPAITTGGSCSGLATWAERGHDGYTCRAENSGRRLHPRPQRLHSEKAEQAARPSDGYIFVVPPGSETCLGPGVCPSGGQSPVGTVEAKIQSYGLKKPRNHFRHSTRDRA